MESCILSNHLVINGGTLLWIKQLFYINKCKKAMTKGLM